MLEKTLESPLDSKEIKPVHPKGNEPWIFLGRTDAEAETPIFWPLDLKSWHIGKDPDAGKDWGQEQKGMTEVEMVGWHHQLNEHEFEQTLGLKRLSSSSSRASLVAQMVKSLPAMQETWVQSLRQEDPLEKEMATHYSILARKIPWMEEAGGLQSMGLQSVGHDWATSL